MPTRNKQQNRPRFLNDVVYVTRDTGNGTGVLNDVVVTPYSEGNYDPDNYKEELAAERARHAELARQYLAQNPTLTNRAKYNYHKYKSTPFGTNVWDIMGKYAPYSGIAPNTSFDNPLGFLNNIRGVQNLVTAAQNSRRLAQLRNVIGTIGKTISKGRSANTQAARAAQTTRVTSQFAAQVPPPSSAMSGTSTYATRVLGQRNKYGLTQAEEDYNRLYNQAIDDYIQDIDVTTKYKGLLDDLDIVLLKQNVESAKTIRQHQLVQQAAKDFKDGKAVYKTYKDRLTKAEIDEVIENINNGTFEKFQEQANKVRSYGGDKTVDVGNYSVGLGGNSVSVRNEGNGIRNITGATFFHPEGNPNLLMDILEQNAKKGDILSLADHAGSLSINSNPLLGMHIARRNSLIGHPGYRIQPTGTTTLNSMGGIPYKGTGKYHGVKIQYAPTTQLIEETLPKLQKVYDTLLRTHNAKFPTAPIAWPEPVVFDRGFHVPSYIAVHMRNGGKIFLR